MISQIKNRISRRIVAEIIFFVFNFPELLNSEDQICLLHAGWFRLDLILTSLHHSVLVVVELDTLVDDTSDPVDVEGDLGVPGGYAQATADTTRHDTDECSSVLIVGVYSLQRTATVSLAGPTEYSILVHVSLGTRRYSCC